MKVKIIETGRVDMSQSLWSRDYFLMQMRMEKN